MAEYKPKYKRKGINPPFGYYVSPIDPSVLLPDPKKLDALEYSFRMRAKYNTAIRDCVQWLHANTGQRMTPAGYLYAYRNWIKKIKQRNGHALAVRKREITEQREKFIEENFGHHTVKLNDKDSVFALAQSQVEKEIKPS